MKNSSSNTGMQDIDGLFRSINKVEVPDLLYDKVMLRVSRNNEIFISGRFLRLAAAVLIMMITTELVIVFGQATKSRNVSSLVELPDNSLNYD